MKRFFSITGLLLAILAVGYMLGPVEHPAPAATLPVELSPDLVRLEADIAAAERNARLRPDNEARIVWADSTRKAKTPFSIVYIPGFTASWAEGDPVHQQLARHFGCNLYLARTHGHGVDSPDALQDLTPANYAQSAGQALAIGQALGNQVVVIGTSAGGMLALYLAAHHPEIYGLVLYSPCIAVANPALKLATKPWGRKILEQAMGGTRVVISHHKPDRARYWLPSYHINGLITLQTMLDQLMTTEQFQRVKQPVFMAYYYKDEENQDKVVSVPDMLRMYEDLGTPVGKKHKEAFPNAGEHVIASHFTSGDLDGVYRATEKFMASVLKMPVVPAAASPDVVGQRKVGPTKK